MTEIKRTGGLHEFRYTKEDDERIRNEDTESSKAFKKSYREWRESRNHTIKEKYSENYRIKLIEVRNIKSTERTYNEVVLVNELKPQIEEKTTSNSDSDKSFNLVQSTKDIFLSALNFIGTKTKNIGNKINSIVQDSNVIDSIGNKVNSAFESSVSAGKEVLTSQGIIINDEWVHNFIKVVNEKRKNKGLQPLKESTEVNDVAKIRFQQMMKNPFISHYGAGQFYGGEVVFYPEGSSPQGYVDDIITSAPLHWDLLVDLSFSSYGYHLEEGPTLQIMGSCSTTGIPGPDIDVKKFFEERGCSTTTSNSIWLVINLI